MCADFEQELRLSSGMPAKTGAVAGGDCRCSVECCRGAVGDRQARHLVFFAFAQAVAGIYCDRAPADHDRYRRERRCFTLADFVLVRPLPFPQSERLVKIWEKHQGYSRMELSPANYRDFKTPSTSFEQVAAFNDSQLQEPGWAGGAGAHRRRASNRQSVRHSWTAVAHWAYLYRSRRRGRCTRNGGTELFALAERVQR